MRLSFNQNKIGLNNARLDSVKFYKSPLIMERTLLHKVFKMWPVVFVYLVPF